MRMYPNPDDPYLPHRAARGECAHCREGIYRGDSLYEGDRCATVDEGQCYHVDCLYDIFVRCGLENLLGLCGVRVEE